MNTIGINDNLDRPRIRKLLIIGLIVSMITGIGDFLLGFGENMAASGLAESMMANAVNLSDGQLIIGVIPTLILALAIGPNTALGSGPAPCAA